MKLRNKKTGEIVERVDITIREVGVVFNNDETYNSLAELNEEWEDLPEDPKEIYFISNNGQIHEEDGHDRYREARKEIGNYFETKEEAELAVRKLKAVKRLKDKGFRFTGINDDEDSQELITQCGILCEADIYHLAKDGDFLLLFGGEE